MFYKVWAAFVSPKLLGNSACYLGTKKFILSKSGIFICTFYCPPFWLQCFLGNSFHCSIMVSLGLVGKNALHRNPGCRPQASWLHPPGRTHLGHQRAVLSFSSGALALRGSKAFAASSVHHTLRYYFLIYKAAFLSRALLPIPRPAASEELAEAIAAKTAGPAWRGVGGGGTGGHRRKPGGWARAGLAPQQGTWVRGKP